MFVIPGPPLVLSDFWTPVESIGLPKPESLSKDGGRGISRVIPAKHQTLRFLAPIRK